MHRHGYKGRKFGRQRDQRLALIKGLADSLVTREEIETTLPKAKALASYTEKLITKAKKGDLHNRRQVIKGLSTLQASHKLVDEIAPKLSGRTSGYLKLEKTVARRGDGAQLAKVSFVDDFEKKLTKGQAKPETAKTNEKAEEKSDTQTNQPRPQKAIEAHTKANVEPAKRAGRRGNR